MTDAAATAEGAGGPASVARAGPSPPTWWLTRFVLLRLLGFVYLVAFLALAQQVIPLLGHDGLLPVDLWLPRVESRFGTRLDAFLHLPSLFWLGHSDALMQGLAWVGVGLSLVVVLGFANAPLLLGLWALYMSFVHVGQEWYSFGWEIQLLETGVLAVFLCPLVDGRPFPRRPPPEPVLWLYRWLIFRIMLGAGLIKLRGDPCWRDLTCLYYHYETQPIPNPISRVLHFMPHWFQKLGVLWSHFAEMVAPWFVFMPGVARHAAGGVLLSLQALLILSGNLSFLNWLTIVPVLACFDDSLLSRVLPGRLVARAERAAREARPSRAQGVLAWALVAVVALLSVAPVSNLLSDRQVMNTSFDPLDLVNTYGAFGSVGQQRNEIILEGTSDPAPGPDTRWLPYEFKAKPGDPRRRPPFISPYQYRVDWEVWFAAMSRPGEHPWLVHLAWKLLHGDRRAAALLATNPFPDAPPRWIRADLYRYRFAPLGNAEHVWWLRERLGPWMRPISADDPGVRRFLLERGLLRPSDG